MSSNFSLSNLHVIDMTTQVEECAVDQQTETPQPDESVEIGELTFVVTEDIQCIHKSMSRLRQYYREGPISLEQCRSAFDMLQPPEGNREDTTRVLFARCSGQKTETARELLIAAGCEPGPALTSSISGNATLVTGHEAGLIVILSNDDNTSEQTAAAIVYTALRAAEVFLHKIAKQFAEYLKIRELLKSNRGSIDSSVQCLAIRLAEIQLGAEASAVDAALKSRHVVANAYQRHLFLLGQAERMLASLQANADNVATYVNLIGDELALSHRITRSKIPIRQIEADLRAENPTMQLARYISELHTDTLLTTLNVNEIAENRLREADANRHRRIEWAFAAVAIWLGVTQLWGAAVAATKTTLSLSDMFRLMCIPAVIVGAMIALLCLLLLYRRTK